MLSTRTAGMNYEVEPYPIIFEGVIINEMEQLKRENGISTCIYGALTTVKCASIKRRLLPRRNHIGNLTMFLFIVF